MQRAIKDDTAGLWQHRTHHLFLDAEADLGLDLVHGGRLEAGDFRGDVLGSPQPRHVLGMVARAETRTKTSALGAAITGDGVKTQGTEEVLTTKYVLYLQ